MKPVVVALLTLAACGRIDFGTLGAPGTADGRVTGDGTGATGDAGADGPLAPSTWQLAAAPPATTADLWAVYAFAPNDLWIAGTTGTIQHYDGAWTPTTSVATNTLFMFWGASPADLTLIGRSCMALHWAGSAWAQTTIPGCSGNQDLMAIAGTSASNVWASGTMGNIQQFTNAWQNRSQSNVDFWDVYTASASDAYAIGTVGTIEHWNGATMTAEPSGTTVTLAAIASPAAGEYWIVGASGVTLHKVGAGAWTLVQAPTTVFLYDVVAVSPTDLWAVGSGGVILHGDGAGWTQVMSPTANTLRNIERVPGGGLVAVGTAGTMITHP